MNAVIPKAASYVGTLPDPAPVPEARAGSLDVGSGPNGTTLALLGLCVAGAGLLLVDGWTLAAGSGRPKTEPEPVKVS